MKCFLSLLLILLLIPAFANDDDKIKELVNRWNELHNTHNRGGFLKLYAPEVLFYGRKNSASECYWPKEKFLNSDFRQEIISNVSITHYRSGIIKWQRQFLF